MTSLIDIHLENVEQHLDEEDKDTWHVIKGAGNKSIDKLLSVYTHLTSKCWVDF
ncbi:hypothetical protein [Xenorhabdus innexi]|uniref:Uncharacterized protein n=1 Tax=Xenorhabdus innexi TaxID=290109 RepID=A0A1N6MUA3_9GAMM|nr:hypothetical protein [Xenorhabdus innexi]PHM28554.1 hypothetical protein Xinn_03816 [Xenorhabdus innexi]SIP72443.1 hypothetical protein XIS1_1480002 [Xenorhabdus innexi]